MPNPSATALCFKVAEALARNVGRAVARPDPDDMRALGLAIGDFVFWSSHHEVMATAQAIFKREWERVKNEVVVNF